MIMAITVKGTQRNIPGTPQRVPQRLNERRMTRGLRLSEFPMSLGSSRFPTRTWVPATPPITMAIGRACSNATRARREGKRVARMEPTVGMKLRKKMSIPQNPARSRPMPAIMP